MSLQDFHKNRQYVVRGIFIAATVVLLVKAMQIQLIDGTYQDRARTTAIEKIIDYPSRGLIYDRNGKLLVNNNAIYDLKCTYNLVDPNMDTTLFIDLLGIKDKAAFKKLINKNFRSARYSKSVPFTFLEKISARTYSRFQESMYEFPGFSMQIKNVRGYPYHNSPHVLGYLSEVSQKQLDNLGNTYQKGDFIGSTGLERTYEKYLRGSKGIRYVLKDNLGRAVGSYKNGKQDTLAVSGKDIRTTLEVEMQELAEELLQGKSGSIVAIEPSSGEILCFVSSPTYDPNLLTINRNRGEAYNALLEDTLRKPFYNRGVMAKYPPGSILKTAFSLIAMQDGLMQPNTGISCSGAYYYNGQAFRCHQHVHPRNVSIALEHSCNTYYFTTLRNIIDQFGFYEPHKGLRALNNRLADFGLGKPLGADISNEGGGNLPTPEYYDNLYPKAEGSWKSPTIMSIGIGQGEIEMTTLQMANLACIMANRGFYYTPHLAKSFLDGTPIPDKFKVKRSVNVNREYFNSIIEGMSRAVRLGTGKTAYWNEVEICGKTGTSQNPHGQDHSVFFAFAPRENPQIAIAVYVENGGWGANYAAPMSSLMIEQYLNKKIADDRLPLKEMMANKILLSAP